MTKKIIIVGAGIIGCSVARQLAKRGAKVQVIERGPAVASEASGASLGCLNYSPGTENPDQWHALASRGIEGHRTLESELKTEGINSVHWWWNGRLNVATSDDAERSIRIRCKEDQGLGYPARMLNKREIHDIEPALGGRVIGGSFNEDSGWVRPPHLTQALYESAQNHGAKFLFNTTAKEIAFENGQATGVICDGEKFSADEVIITAGAWSPQLDRDHNLEIIPLRGQTLFIAIEPPLPVSHVLYGRSIYIVPWEDGLSIGSTHEDVGFIKGNTAAGISKLLANGISLIPKIGEYNWDRIKIDSGLRPAKLDKIPHIGPDPNHKNLWWAAGHMYHGILLAPLTGKLLADAIIDDNHSELLTN